jgi:hypothetical protein
MMGCDVLDVMERRRAMCPRVDVWMQWMKYTVGVWQRHEIWDAEELGIADESDAM